METLLPKLETPELLHMEVDGAQKAAVLFLVLGKEKAVGLAKHFSKNELKIVVDAAANLNELKAEVIEGIIDEFGKNLNADDLRSGTNTLSEYFHEASKQNTSNRVQTAATTLEISQLEFDVVKNFFENEPPQISALLLPRLEENMVVKVVSALDAEHRNAIFRAFCYQKKMDLNLQSELEAGLLEMLLEIKVVDETNPNIETAANLINQLPDETSDDLVNFFEEQDAVVAETIRKSLFKFQSIELLSKENRAVLVDGIDTEDLVLALANTNENLRTGILEVLSQRSRRLVESELTRTTPTPEDIDSAQKIVVRSALKLSREGVIELPQTV